VADGRCRVSDIFGYQRSAPFGSIEIWHLDVSTLGLKVVRGSIEYSHLLSREAERHFEPIRRRERHNDGLRIGSKFDAYVLSRLDQTKGLVMVLRPKRLAHHSRERHHEPVETFSRKTKRNLVAVPTGKIHVQAGAIARDGECGGLLIATSRNNP
jgi:hypothetical protein